MWNNYGAIQSFCFQYCDFSIAPCKVITLDPLFILFGISSWLLFWWIHYRSSNYRESDSCRSFSFLKAIAIRLPLLFANDFKSVKARQLLPTARSLYLIFVWSDDVLLLVRLLFFITNQNAVSWINQSEFTGRSYKIGKKVVSYLHLYLPFI